MDSEPCVTIYPDDPRWEHYVMETKTTIRKVKPMDKTPIRTSACSGLNRTRIGTHDCAVYQTRRRRGATKTGRCTTYSRAEPSYEEKRPDLGAICEGVSYLRS